MSHSCFPYTMCSINYIFSLTSLESYDMQLELVNHNFIVNLVLRLEFWTKEPKYTCPIKIFFCFQSLGRYQALGKDLHTSKALSFFDSAHVLLLVKEEGL